MKQLRLMLVSLLAVIFYFPGPGRAAEGDGYRKTVETHWKQIRLSEDNLAYIQQGCQGNAAKKMGFMDAIKQVYPGSNITCVGLSGVFRLADGVDMYIVNGELNRQVGPPWRGVTQDINFVSEAGKIVGVSHVTSDSSGNYIRFFVDLKDPSQSHFIDARLPVSMQSGRAAVGEKGGGEHYRQ